MQEQSKAHISNFRIADFDIRIIFEDAHVNNISLIPSFAPFISNETSENLFFQMTVDDTLSPVPKDQRERIRKFDTGNGETIVDLLPDGGYQFIIKDITNAECCLLITDKDFSTCRCALNGTMNMRRFGLNSALMLTFAFAGCTHDTLLIHASLVRHNGYGYAFIAKSGTGKSTQVSMWLRHIPNCDLMNDDNPIIRIIDGKPYIYGGPWSGKTPCYRNVKAPLGAITRIDRAKSNSIEKLSAIEAFASVLPACSSMKWDVDIFEHICDSVTKIVETTNIYTLHCLPNKESALLCKNHITINNKE